ncbi:hypothetical protein [Ideonella livida]|uniref:Uncharacterized protein n=1 Tax=Ideonella livida TaxID=2707176 RepID=A0A7C9TIF2_9BURK|nr:hypothetical protein [Ideonella livida]NDY90223.1 hypothetical protein [Ideonella livida]
MSDFTPTGRRHATTLLLIGLLVGAAPAWAQAPTAAPAVPSASAAPAATPLSPALSTAFGQFQRAAEGDKEAMEAAAEALAAALRQQPANLTLLAYAGASQTMLANTTMLPWKKMRFADDGLAQLDKALAQLNAAHEAPDLRGVPTVLEVKLLAANTFLAVPGFFNRSERGARLLHEVLRNPLLASAPASFKESVAAAQKRHADKLGR